MWSVLYSFLLASLILWPWTLIDALRRPESHWKRAGQNRRDWIVRLIFLGSIGSIIYLLVARPELEKIKGPMGEPSPSSGNSYWGLVLLLVGFGFITGFSIGIPFLLVGVTLAMLSPFRSRPRVFWSGLALVVGFLVGYVLVAPFSCSVTAEFDLTTGVETMSPEMCRSLVGIEYTGSPRTAGLITGGVLAVVGAAAGWIAGGRQPQANPQSPS